MTESQVIQTDTLFNRRMILTLGNRRGLNVVVAMVLVLLVAGCGGGGGGEAAAAPQVQAFAYSEPRSTGDGWATGHIDDFGFDSSKIVDMMTMIINGEYANIDAVTIVKDDTLVLYSPLRNSLDEYDGWVDNITLARHIMHSTSKSVTSALIGIAIDQGYIASTDIPFYSLFNYASYDNWDARKSAMTLEDALTMRLGLQWDEWRDPYGDPNNDLQILTSQNTDYAKALLDLPLESDPGTSYTYNTAATIAIGQALQNSVGVPMEDFAEAQLFQPLQILNADWGRTPTQLPNGGSGLFLEPRDMVKFGQLFLSGGVWNGQQIISPDWIDRSVQRHVSLGWTWTSGYGFQWWLDNFQVNGQRIDSWSTRGYGGQYIFCVPSLNLVVAFTGSNYDNGEADNPMSLMQDFILPSLAN